MPTRNLSFPADRFSPPVITVSELNASVADMLQRTFPLVWVSGEISNFTRAASGHWYFTLKDRTAQVRVVMFKSRTRLADFSPKDGQKVEVRATLSLYAARGDFQLNAEDIRLAGSGNLYEAFVRLKAKLEAEGLFDASRKKALPFFTKTIGIVTSPKAAALRDVATTLARRAPYASLLLFATPVQGEEAPSGIVRAISAAAALRSCDVLIICRGGGSIEDLWSFNDESVARAIASCPIPTISGVGHETDFTIADFVADLRAPTPTGAAEMAARATSEWLDLLGSFSNSLKKAMKWRLQNSMQATDELARKLVSPANYMAREKIRLDALASRLSNSMGQCMADSRHALEHLATRLGFRLPDLSPAKMQVAESRRRLAEAFARQAIDRRKVLDSLSSQLELLNPARTLKRGYAILSDRQGNIIRSPESLPLHEPVSLQLAHGNAEIAIESVSAKEKD